MYATLADFGNPDRISVIRLHRNIETAQASFRNSRSLYEKSYTPTTGSRVWTIALPGGISLSVEDIYRGSGLFATLIAEKPALDEHRNPMQYCKP